MADTATPAGTAARRPSTLGAYRAVLSARLRGQRSYRANFVTDLVSSALVGLVELAEVWLLFHNVGVIGGLDFAQVLLVFAIADLSFSCAQLAFGHVDRMPAFLRAGSLDVLYLRPQPVLLQVVTSDLQIRRLARAAVGVAALVVALRVNPVHWDAGAVALLAVTLVAATATHAAMLVWAGGLQFFLLDASELTNAFVYGGRYAASQVAAVWPSPLVLVFGFLFPMATTSYVPALRLLEEPGPAWLPTSLAWWTPLFAAWMWGFALWSWRAGIRHYQGGGG